ncbi:MAG: protease inhibitor I42 family protein [Acidobacteria bacterium]|nr:protease inhibitor I42 family protein [Acidobacteriota bacterium]
MPTPMLLLLLAFCLSARPGTLYTTRAPLPSQTHEVTFTVEDDGRSVILSSGDFLTLRLETQMGTGYRWEVAGNDARRLKLIGNSVEPLTKGDEGGHEIQIFRFKALSRGPSRLRLQYKRPWGRSTPSKTFSISVSVRRA